MNIYKSKKEEELREALLSNHTINFRPWGFYCVTSLTDFFQTKIIYIRPGEQLSLQSHKFREEYWVVIEGTGIVQLDESSFEVRRGSFIHIPISCKHQLKNVNEKKELIISEVQTGDYFGEDDITRYKDIYGRI